MWPDIPLNPKTRVLRQFAAGWLVFFIGVAAHQYLVRHHHRTGLILAAMAVVVGVVGLLRPALVRWLFVASMVLAFPIGYVVSSIVLLVLFYGVLTPFALIFRLRGRDMLRRKQSPGQSTFWLEKRMPDDVRSYFRQY